MKRTTLLSLAIITVMIAGAAPMAAASESKTLSGPDGYTVELTCSPKCPSEAEITVQWTPIDGGGYTVELACTPSSACGKVEVAVPVVRPEPRFEVDLSASAGFLFSASEAYGAYHAGAELAVRYHIGGDWWIKAAVGAGYGHIDGIDAVAFVETGLFQYRFADWGSFGFGLQHQVLVDPAAGRDPLHTVQPVLEASFYPTTWLQIALRGGAGWGRHNVRERTSAGSTKSAPEYDFRNIDAEIGGASINIGVSF